MSIVAEKIIKNDPCFLRFSQDISRNHILHAQLVCTPDLAYAKEFCLLCMQKILEKNGLSHLSHKIENGTYIDLLELSSNKSIKVEDLNLLIEKSSNRAIESDFKFFLIVGASNMTPEAQNKLLKTLEEPNANQFFFLCVPSRFLVLQTICSRCNVVELEPLEKNVIKNFLVDHHNAPLAAAEEAAELSLGSVCRAEELLSTTTTSFGLALDTICGIGSSSDCIKYVTKLQKSDLSEVLEYTLFIISDALKIKSDANEIWFKSKKQQIENLAKTSYAGLIFIYDAILKLKELQKANVSAVSIIDKFVLAIAEGKHK